MSDENDNGRSGGRPPLTLKPRGPGAVSAGTVKQSFSHGRSKTVVVETKRARTHAPQGSNLAAPSSAERRPSDQRPSGPRPAAADANSGLSGEELRARQRAIEAAREHQARQAEQRAREERARAEAAQAAAAAAAAAAKAAAPVEPPAPPAAPVAAAPAPVTPPPVAGCAARAGTPGRAARALGPDSLGPSGLGAPGAARPRRQPDAHLCALARTPRRSRFDHDLSSRPQRAAGRRPVRRHFIQPARAA
jgi:translation initiation factor IF-2